ncbi:hypothetical protein PG984_005048 [Apiospora sp. TS-2023a]
MFARYYPRKQSSNSKNRYDDAFKQICFIKDLVDSIGVDASLRKHLESQYRGQLAHDKPRKGKQTGPPLSRLIHDIQSSGDGWTMDPADYHPSSLSKSQSIRLSEIVIILFLHHEYIREHTDMGPYEIYNLSMAFADMFFDQISRHFKSGKIHTTPMDSPAATNLAIDLGTLFFLVSYGPAHLQTKDLLDTTPVESSVSLDNAKSTSSESHFLRSLPGNNRAMGYIVSELDHVLKPTRPKLVQSRGLPFKATALADRWAFLNDYLSHWVDRIGLYSTETSSVTSSLLLAHKMCCLRLPHDNRSYDTCQPLQRPFPMNENMPRTLQELSDLCKQLQDRWTPQRASDALQELLGDRRTATWHLMALWWQNSGRERQEDTPSHQQKVAEVYGLFPMHIREHIGSAETFEPHWQEFDTLRAEAPDEMDIIQQEWQAISHDVSLPTQRRQELAGIDDRRRQITMESFLRHIWL